ncbi:hypothetical protein J2S62_001810 [Enteractinococcus fodinae]|uniref:Uncharacterized protein n=1 Tax=Enteractinococcus fodinae TaxID=684663 RepID=A0ABU2B433_9MICC|nr:hypothetical protein [Enteractinococcus fodinae]
MFLVIHKTYTTPLSCPTRMIYTAKHDIKTRFKTIKTIAYVTARR